MQKNKIIILTLIISSLLVIGSIHTFSSNYSPGGKNYTPPVEDYVILYSIHEDFTKENAINSIKPCEDSSDLGFKIIDQGTTIIAGTKVYYTIFIDEYNSNTFNGELFYQKNDDWYFIQWKDQPGNPNKDVIDREVENIIRKDINPMHTFCGN